MREQLSLGKGGAAAATKGPAAAADTNGRSAVVVPEPVAEDEVEMGGDGGSLRGATAQK